MLAVSNPIYLIRTHCILAAWLVLICEPAFSAPSPKPVYRKENHFEETY